MNAWAWVLVCVFALSALVSIGMTGRQREPSTPGVVVAAVIIDALLIGVVLKAVGVL